MGIRKGSLKKKKDYHNNYEIVVKALSSTCIANNSEAGD